MRKRIQSLFMCGMAIAAMPTAAWGQAIDWQGGVSSDATNGVNWGGGAVPGATSNVEIRNGGSQNKVLDLGANDATWGHILFNHADDGTTVNGSGTIAVTVLDGGTNINIKSIESQGGERLSTINPNVVTNAVIEARNGHDLAFNGAVTAHTVHAYDTSDVIFNGDATLTGYTNGGDFLTGSGTVHFNQSLTLDRQEGGGFGIRNGMRMVIGEDAILSRTLPEGGFGAGLDTVNLYSNATMRVEGDALIGHNTDLFSRYGGPGSGHDPNNTFDLNGHSDNVELLGTHPGANFIIDFGATPGANTLTWTTTHHMPGTYQIEHFEFNVDALNLGSDVNSPWWTAADMETDGGGSPDIEVKKSNITINGLPYSAFDAQKTTPYWTLEDPALSRAVTFFNLQNLPPDADFDDSGVVDGNDFLIWQRGVGLTGQTLNTTGDANHDGTVNGADLTAWRAAFGTAGGSAAGSPVPEPGAVALGFVAAFAAAGYRRVRGLR